MDQERVRTRWVGFSAGTIVVGAMLALGLTGCAASAPGMHARADAKVPAQPGGAARVTFARAGSGCDTFDSAIVTDEAGHFVGALAPNTEFVADVPEGRRAFFLWPTLDLRSEKTANFEPVDVVDLDLHAGQSQTVNVQLVVPHEGRGHCYRYAVFYFAKPTADASDAGFRIVESDPAAGQAFLSERKDVSGAYYLMDKERLAKRRANERLITRRREELRAAGF